MRILIVTREYPSVTPYTGGIGTTFAVLCPELVKQGHEVHVLCPSARGRGFEERDGVRFHLRREPIPHRRLHFLAETVWMFQVEHTLPALGRFDVIFAAEWGGDMTRYVRRRERPAGPVVVQLTSSLQQLRAVSPGLELSIGWKLRWAIQPRYERYQTERADAILASSNSILAWARRLWEIDGVRSVVVPNVLRVDRVKRLAAAGTLPDGWPEQGPVVAFSGRLEERKGVHVLTRAMRTVWERHPDAQLVLMGRDGPHGEGWMSDHVRELAGADVGKLHILGNQAPERLFAALGRADVVALPSRWENFASAALEAMAMGAPVVLTTGGGFEDFVRPDQDGLLVAPDDPAALAVAIASLLEDAELRERLGRSAAEKVMEYDAPTLTQRYVEFFAEVAAASARAWRR